MQPGLYTVLTSTTGPDTTRFVKHGNRSLRQQQPSGQWQHLLTDGLGSVRSVLDANHLPLETVHYTPYGEGSPTESLLGFTGEPTDANGLVHLRARYYDPALGVFPSLDPVEDGNRYAYVQGNPINAVDPTGLFDWHQYKTIRGDTLSCIGAEGGIRREHLAAFADHLVAMHPHITHPDLIIGGKDLFPPNEWTAPDGTYYSNIVATGKSNCGKVCDCCLPFTRCGYADYPFTPPSPTAYFPNTCYSGVEPTPRPNYSVPGLNSGFRPPNNPNGPTCNQKRRAVIDSTPIIGQNQTDPLVQSRGFVIGGEGPVAKISIPIPLLGVSIEIGWTAGGSVALIFETQSWHDILGSFSDCELFVSGETGLGIGANLTQGLYSGLIWSNADLNSFEGATFNISGDLVGVNGGFSVSQNNCNYTAFIGYELPVLSSFSFSDNVQAGGFTVSVTGGYSVAPIELLTGKSLCQLVYDGIRELDVWNDISSLILG